MLVPRVIPLLQAGVLAAAPFGGQHTARRNAWAAMSADAARARARRDADLALQRAATRADVAPAASHQVAR